MASMENIVDPLLKILCKRCSVLSHRSLFIVRGENITEKVVTLHHLITSQSGPSSQSSVLWCHKKDANLPRSSNKALKSISNKLQSGKITVADLKPLDLWLMSVSVKFCSYYDSQSVLGNTYKLCVLQDIECLTPNLLCHVVETVQGGGAVIVLLPEVQHLREVAQLDMDAHYRLTTHSHPIADKLFNTRLMLSLAWCNSCIVLDEKLNICHDITGMKYKSIQPVTPEEMSRVSETHTELKSLQDSLQDASKPLPQLIGLCRTPDQAKCVMKLVDVLTERQLKEVVSVTAGRGRGKSAAMGLAVAAAIDLGLNNIFVTSPSPTNLTAFFQLLFAGFDALEYKEGSDYDILQSTNPEFSGAVVRVNVYREGRQTVQYVLPADHAQVTQAELVVIDEAAAIPLPQVQAMLGQHLTLMSSTIAGYEGTGRSLSLKLLKQLRSKPVNSAHKASLDGDNDSTYDARNLHELSLERSIRYGADDPVEEWLYKLLCLNATQDVTEAVSCPAPQLCNLYHVNKHVLLSGNKASEQFLLQVQSLLVSSHYRNSPDDLQILSDSSAHHLFALLPPLPADGHIRNIPPVLCVLQVCLEGGVSPTVAQRVYSKGERPPGDLVPWSLVNQFRDPSLAHYTGARIIRIATHPNYQGMGYGSRSMHLLKEHYSGRLLLLDHVDDEPQSDQQKDKHQHSKGPLGPRKLTEAMLCPLSSRVPERVDYVSVSYGITTQLHKFWAKAGFAPVYIGQVVNKKTGEHNCMMALPISDEADAPMPTWLEGPCKEFVRRFLVLLGGPLRSLHPAMAHDLIKAHHHINKPDTELTWREAECQVNGHSLRRLERYSKNIVERHVITDLLPALASLYCTQRLPGASLSNHQSALLVGTGLQNLDVIDVGRLLQLEPASTLGNFRTAVRRVYLQLAALQEKALSDKLAVVVPDLLQPVDITVEQDLERIAKQTEEERPDLHFHKKRGREADTPYFKANYIKNKKTKTFKKNKYSNPM